MTSDFVNIGNMTYRVEVRESGHVSISTCTIGTGMPVQRGVLIHGDAFVSVMQLARKVWDADRAKREKE